MSATSTPRRSEQSGGRFLVLPENRLAYTAVVQLFSTSTQTTHPLVVLFGPSGTGKSHLAQFCAKEADRLKFRERRMRITASEFAADLVRASAAVCIPEFQESYRRLDLLICEDLQALEGRSEAQQQLLVVIEEILQADGRVLLTSNKSPGELQRYSPRLINRFHGGLCVPVELPGRTSRKKLLMEFATAQQLPVPEGVLSHLAESFPVTPRELRGILLQLEQLAARRGQSVDGPLVDQFLKDWQTPAGSVLKHVTAAVARAYALKPQQIRTGNRSQGLVLPRQVTMYVARMMVGQSCAGIGAYFGKNSHSTVVHACHRIEDLLTRDPGLRQVVSQIQDDLRQSGLLCRGGVD